MTAEQMTDDDFPEVPKKRPKAFRPDLRDTEVGVRPHITDDSPCWCGPQIAHVAADEQDIALPVDHLITDVTSYSEDTMFKVQAAITSLGYSGQPVLDLIGAMQNAGILFREHGPTTILPDDEQGFEDDGLESYKWAGDPHHGHEYDHYTERSRNLCLGGDHDAAVMWDRDAERVKVRENERRFQDREHWSDTIKSENVEATMAEEPIEDRLRRAWLNGFKDGVDRASYATTESTGRWDY